MSAIPADTLSKREAEVLDAVARRLSNAEIAALLFISVRTVESHVSSLLRKLDAADRRALVDIGRARREYALGSTGEVAPRFVGRDDELTLIAELVGSERLITVTGPGGTGKTRLAVEFARRDLDAFPDGVVTIELAPLRDAALVPAAAAGAVGVKTDAGADIVGVVTEYLAHRRTLVLLDNCEHVVAAAAELANALVTNAGRVVVLATSREPLRLRAERVVRLAPLAVPEPGTTANDMDASASMTLFADRAASVDPDFRVTSDNRLLVRDVCAAVDGLPLALELAAARLQELPLDALARSLNKSLAVLDRGSRDTPERHQTLRATVDWSYQLLQAQERQLFDRLSVFAGGFSVDAAEAVCGFGDLDSGDVDAGLAALVSKSLVIRDGSSYRLLEPVRQFAAERLSETNEGGVADRHLEYFATSAEALGLGYTTAGSVGAFAALRQAGPNIRAALTHAFTSGDAQAKLGGRLAGAIGWQWFVDGLLAEGSAWIDRGLERVDDSDVDLRLRLLYCGAALALARADLPNALRMATEVEELATTAGRDDLLAFGIDIRGNAHWGLGQLAEAEAALARSSELSERAGVPWHGAFALAELGRVVWERGDATRAAELAERALEASTALGEDMQTGFALDVLANQAFAHGRLDDADELGERSLEHYSRIGYREGTASAGQLLARTALARGDLDTARRRLAETLRVHRQLGQRSGIAAALETTARLLCVTGEREAAAVALGAADRLRSEMGVAPTAMEKPLVDEVRAALMPEFTEAIHRGGLLDLDGVIAYSSSARMR